MRNSYATNCGLHFRFNFNFVWTMVECNTYLQFQDSLSPYHEMRCTVTCATKSSNNFQIMVHSIYFLACGKHHAHIFQPRTNEHVYFLVWTLNKFSLPNKFPLTTFVAECCQTFISRQGRLFFAITVHLSSFLWRPHARSNYPCPAKAGMTSLEQGS